MIRSSNEGGHTLWKSLARQFIFSGLDPGELKKLADIAMMRSYRSRSYVFLEGEERHSVYFIGRGVVKVYKTDAQGEEHIVSFLKEGEMFPHAGFFESDPYPGTAEVVLDSQFCVVPMLAFESLIRFNPEIAMKVMRMMGRKIRELQVKLRDVTSLDIGLRLAALLLSFVEDHGTQHKHGILLDLKLTNYDLAKMAGTTRETVNRLLNKWKKDEVLDMDSNRLVVKNLEALEQLVRGR